jgi:hypothetical protein
MTRDGVSGSEAGARAPGVLPEGADSHFDDGPWIECWQCGGEGVVYDCVEEYACVDPEDGCDYCARRCDICKGKGGWSDE